MQKNIIYFSPMANKPMGGVKVIHRHCEIINSIGGKSEIYYHIGDQNIDWFKHQTPVKQDSVFNKDSDFVLLPESLIFTTWKQLRDLGIQFGIFVQNGYLVNKGISDEELWPCYEAASYIVCISEDAINCVSSYFPEFAKKIIRITCSVDFEIFKSAEKKNIITYMPRKMQEHSDLLIPILKKRLPEGWSMLPIDNMSEAEVASTLATSRIFLAFSGLEGLGLPPIEAALCGNFVIGYTGNGGREYWNPPIFEKIESGDIATFINSVLRKVNEIEEKNIVVGENQLFFLRGMFSIDNETAMIKNMLQVIARPL